jgi:hypothetical protein
MPPALATALRTLPHKLLQDNYTLSILLEQDPSLLEHEEETERGTVKTKDNSTQHKFWEATDREAVLVSHKNTTMVKLEDFEGSSVEHDLLVAEVQCTSLSQRQSSAFHVLKSTNSRSCHADGPGKLPYKRASAWY